MEELVIPEKRIFAVEGTAIPKPKNDQNTDDILPARYLKEITFAKMGEYAYFDERFKDGKPAPDHPFNDERYKGANILIAGANYGCGSSREHAPQGLKRFGIDAIVAPSFSEIFAGNCSALGVACVTVPEEVITQLVEQVEDNPKTQFGADLVEKVIMYDGNSINFDMPEGRRKELLTGTWDKLAVLRKYQDRADKTIEALPYFKFE